VQDAGEPTGVYHRYAEHRRDTLGKKQRVDDVAVVDVFDRDWTLLPGDPAGESFPDPQPEALLDLFLPDLWPRSQRD